MAAADTALAKARQVFSKHGGMLRTSEAILLGIHPRILYALRDSGEIEQVGRGLYRLSTAPPLSSPDLVPVAIRIPRTVVCLVSPLAHQRSNHPGSTVVDIALPSHVQALASIRLRLTRLPVKIYSPKKTIAAGFKYRNKIGLNIAIEALRAYRERTRKPNRAALTKLAQVNRVQKVMRPYLEAVL